MKRFSQRIGAVETPNILQLDAVSDPLRNSIWNFIVSLFDDGESGWWRIAEQSSQFFFKLPVDELPRFNIRRREWIKGRFMAMPWYEVYDFAEFISESYETARDYPKLRRARIHSILNRIFEEELGGYRFVGGELVPMSNPAEVASIESAL